MRINYTINECHITVISFKQHHKNSMYLVWTRDKTFARSVARGNGEIALKSSRATSADNVKDVG
jgi:hypothetical protein